MPSHATIVAPPPESLTLREKILLAALTIEAETFGTGRLVVRAWERYPADFALDGEPHPDSNVVIAKLSGAEGIVGLGWFERTQPGTFRVTQIGRNHALSLDVRDPAERRREIKASQRKATKKNKSARQKSERAATADAAPKAFTERDILAVARLAKSPVFGRFNRAVALTADDAREFWSRTSPDAVRELLDRATDYVIHARRPDGRVPEVGTLGVLRNLNSTLALRFPSRDAA
jgi:hypothetical protein